MSIQGRIQTKVLVVNCGSSSIKYQLLAMDEGRMLAGGLLERIGETVSVLRHRAAQGTAPLAEMRRDVVARDHREAFSHIGAALRASDMLTGAEELAGIGHRVVHGGESFSEPTLIDARVTEAIRALSSLAPLHNPANLSGIEVCREAFPDVPQVAVFDTAFHQTMPSHAYRYAVPEAWYRDHGVRRYGFHGTSHRYVAERAADRLSQPLEQLNLITLHLGNGASAAAIEKGRCIDTSMGFTPLEGLVMGTRCGDLDPAVPLFIQKSAGLSAEGVDRTLNQESGLKGLCGTNDLREVLAQELAGESKARLALELYGYRIKKYIGAYCAALETVDAVVFTGGVGENASRVRSLSCSGLERLGIALDEAANLDASREPREIGRAGFPVRVLVIPTNEELQIARETLAVVRRF